MINVTEGKKKGENRILRHNNHKAHKIIDFFTPTIWVITLNLDVKNDKPEKERLYD